jgi:hypothetical protein
VSSSSAIWGSGTDLLDSYLYSPSPVLVGEMDGLRIISTETCEFVEKVPGKSPPASHNTSLTLPRCKPRGIRARIPT